mmetsp:Transcript_41467/g.127859  ORF Transcript_41467/g.127859 Transcript_41467/m.127859 type:complete len:284 (-) Transcript_41467:123-974(-)
MRCMLNGSLAVHGMGRDAEVGTVSSRAQAPRDPRHARRERTRGGAQLMRSESSLKPGRPVGFLRRVCCDGRAATSQQPQPRASRLAAARRQARCRGLSPRAAAWTAAAAAAAVLQMAPPTASCTLGCTRGASPSPPIAPSPAPPPSSRTSSTTGGCASAWTAARPRRSPSGPSRSRRGALSRRPAGRSTASGVRRGWSTAHGARPTLRARSRRPAFAPPFRPLPAAAARGRSSHRTTWRTPSLEAPAPPAAVPPAGPLACLAASARADRRWRRRRRRKRRKRR